jgi:hypothetical protein
MRYIKSYNVFNEALLPSQFRKYVNNFDKERYADIFKEIGDVYEHDRNYYRIYIPVEKEKIEGYISETHEKVDEFLNQNGLEIVDYISGSAKYKREGISFKKNEEITTDEVRLVGSNVTPGEYKLEDALRISKEMNLDLVETSIKGSISICQIVDYSTFLKSKENNFKTVSIGQILQRLKNDSLNKLFISDEKRKSIVSTEGDGLMVVISRHPYDIAGSDTDRDWTNCMTIGTKKSSKLTQLMDEMEIAKADKNKSKISDLKNKIQNLKADGSNISYLMDEVQSGSLVSYLITSNDKNINKPLGVLNIKPFLSQDESEYILVSNKKMYGIPRPEFKKTVDEILDKYFNKNKKSNYFKLHKKVYFDGSVKGETRAVFNLDKMSLEEKCDIFLKGTQYKINEDGTVDAKGIVDISEKGLTKIPIKFGKVTGQFYCNNNNLTDLENAPREVTGDFTCNNNSLTTLKGCPSKIGSDFNCDENKLITLEHGPVEVFENYYCRNNNLVDLKGFPKKLEGHYFSCENNGITSLKYLEKNTLEEAELYSNPIRKLENLFYPAERNRKWTENLSAEENKKMKKFEKSYGCIGWIKYITDQFVEGNNIIRSKFEEQCLKCGIEVPSSVEGYNFI